MQRASSKPLRIAILENPRSGKNRRRNPLKEIIANYPDTPYHQVITPADVKEAVFQLSNYRPELFIIHGGDGTVQATMGVLLEHHPLPKPPLLAILPGGTTNMTAGDVGLRGNREKSLHKLIQWAQQPNREAIIQTRHVLKVHSPLEKTPLYGMFFGAAAIMHGIRYCRQQVHTKGIRGEWGPGLAMARLLFDFALGRSTHIASEPVTLQIDGRAAERHDSLILIVSTLERLFLGLNPFWGAHHGTLKCTLLQYPPQNLLRMLPSLLRGKPHPRLTPEHGYISHRASELRVTLNGGFTLDGELHNSNAHAGPLVIQPGGHLDFVQV